MSIFDKFQDVAAGMEQLSELGVMPFGAEIEPVTVEVAGETRRLEGSAATQYAEWRRLMREIYEAETGFEVPRLHDSSYGARLPGSSRHVGLWAASSGWKVSQTRPVPSARTSALAIAAARNAGAAAARYFLSLRKRPRTRAMERRKIKAAETRPAARSCSTKLPVPGSM
mgnify:CR=1 FL=1